MSRNALFMYTFSFFIMRKFGKLHSGSLRRTAVKMIEEPVHSIHCVWKCLRLSITCIHLPRGDNESK